MGQNQFVESLVEVMLSWMRWLTSWFWNIVNSKGTSGGFLHWFSENWLGVAVTLIIIGVVADWLVWMIRWRPYWLWLRKRQIIYEDVKPRRHSPRRQPAVPATDPSDDFDDPFAAPAQSVASEASSSESDLAAWDSADDPYATQNDRHTEYDPSIYARPALGDKPRENPFVRRRPVFGERMKQTDVDDRQSN